MESSVDHLLQAFSPQVVIFSDKNVDRACEVNGCKGLDELFKPWQSKIERVPILSSALTRVVHPAYAVRFVAHTALMQSISGGGGTVPYSVDIVEDIISHLVATTTPDQNLQYDILRDVVLASSPLHGHNTFNHPVCHMFASSSSSTDPVAVLHDLSRAARHSPVLSNISKDYGSDRSPQRFYLLVHDVAREGPDLNRPQQILHRISETFGPHCSLLVINSRLQHVADSIDLCRLDTYPGQGEPRSAPDEYMMALNDLICVNPFSRLTEILNDNVRVQKVGSRLIARRYDDEPPENAYAQYLDEDDIERIQQCIRGVTVQSIIPWMEARVREWSDIHSQSRKGVAAKLFGVGRKLFGSANPGLPESRDHSSSSTNVHANEDLSKRLADFAFMLRDYRQAVSVYESIQVFNSAGAEDWHSDLIGIMRIVSGLLQANIKDKSPVDTNDRCSLQTESLRYSTQLLNLISSGREPLTSIGLDSLCNLLLFIEILGHDQLLSNYRCALALRNVISHYAQRADDVYSAILSQKAATITFRLGSGFLRKRALDFLLASQKYAECGLKRFCKANLLQALDNVNGHSPAWRYSEVYLAYTLAQLEYTASDAESAMKRFLSMLVYGVGSPYQVGILQDAALACQRYLSEGIPRGSVVGRHSPVPGALSLNAVRVAPLEIKAKQASTKDLVATVANRSNLPLRLSNIGIWFQDDIAELTMLSPSEKEPDMMILPLGRKLILSGRAASILPNAKTCRMIYSIEKNFQLAQEIPLQRESDNFHTIPENGLRLGQEPAEDAGLSPVESPLHSRFLGVPSTIRNHEKLGFTLSVFNDSEFDISAIYFESRNPEWHVSWTDGGDEIAYETSNTKKSDSTLGIISSSILMKVLQPAELRHITGTVVVHALHDYSIFDGDFTYDYLNIKRVEHKKDICSVKAQPSNPSPLSAIFVRCDQKQAHIFSDIDIARRAIGRKVIANDPYQIQAFAANEHPVHHSPKALTYSAQLYRYASLSAAQNENPGVVPSLFSRATYLPSDWTSWNIPVRISGTPFERNVPSDAAERSAASQIIRQSESVVPAHFKLPNPLIASSAHYDFRLTGGIETGHYRIGKIHSRGELSPTGRTVVTFRLLLDTSRAGASSTWTFTASAQGKYQHRRLPGEPGPVDLGDAESSKSERKGDA